MFIYIIILIILAAAFYFIFLKRHGRLDFWKILSKDPDGAYEYLKEHPNIWFVIDSDSSSFTFNQMKLNPKFKDDWTGPYYLAVPSIGRTIKIYGNIDNYQKEQEIVVENFNKFPNSPLKNDK